MRKLLLSITAVIGGFFGQAQNLIATFDTLGLSQPDTFYVNYSSPGNDVGFDDGYIHFPCVYDTAFGFSFWSSGFAYSNMTDSSTSGIINQYAAKTAKGYNNSPNYAVAYGVTNKVDFLAYPIPLIWAVHKIAGFYITNNTYAYNSMRDGDAFAKKFGGVSGNDPDWFKLTVRGYKNGQWSDSVEFYLADFRDANNANDYIVKDWQWIDLDTLGYIDSLQFNLSSSDNGQFGMNTPAYFCIDNFSTAGYTSVHDVANNAAVKIYPNPATDKVFIEMKEAIPITVSLFDLSGKVLKNYKVNEKLNSIRINDLPQGMYLLRLDNGKQTTSLRIIKK